MGIVWSVDRFTPALAAALVAAFWAIPARADVLHLKEADYERGHYEFEAINAGYRGFPANAGTVVHGHEMGLGYGLSESFSLKGLVAGHRQQDESLLVTHTILEAIATFYRPADDRRGVTLSWFQAGQAAVDKRSTNSTIFGPIVTWRDGPWSIGLNPFFEKTFGNNSEPGVSLVYAWQARYDLNDTVTVGVAGYGRVPDIADAPGIALQVHRIGPMVVLSHELARPTNAGGEPLHGALEIGLLLGLTEATSDHAVKANYHIRF